MKHIHWSYQLRMKIDPLRALQANFWHPILLKPKASVKLLQENELKQSIKKSKVFN